MNMAVFSNTYLPRLSGPSISISQTTKWLRQQEYAVRVIAPEYRSLFSPRPPEKGVTRVSAIRLFSFGPFAIPLPFGAMTIRRVLDRFQPDLIHIHQPFLLGTIGIMEARRRHLPLVYTFHTLYQIYGGYLGFIKPWMQEKLKQRTVDACQAADRVIAPTQAIQHYLLDEGVTTPIEIIPTGIQLQRYVHRPSPSVLRALRTSLQIGPTQPLLLLVGRIGREKNVQLLCEAIVRLHRVRPDIVTLFIGEGTEEKKLQAFLKKRQCLAATRWIGVQPQSQLPAYYHVANLFVFPSLLDTQPIVLYEALAAGLPIVAVDSMAAREAIEPGKNGLLSVATPRAFSKAILNGLQWKSYLHAQLDPHTYEANVIARRHLDLYASLVSRR
jgi:glycosyltransferase involved in cell wall biosynthesis